MHTFDQGNGYWKRKDLYFIYFNKSILETSSELVNLGLFEYIFGRVLYFINFNKLFLETSPELHSLPTSVNDDDDDDYANNNDGSTFWEVAFEIAFQLWLFHTFWMFHTFQTFLFNFMLPLFLSTSISSVV